MVALAYASRSAMLNMRGGLMRAGKAGKMVLSLAMVALALMILTGADKPVEAWLVDHLAGWLTQLTTRF